MTFWAKMIRSALAFTLIASLLMLAGCAGNGPITANKAKLPQYESEFDSTKFYSIVHKSERALDARTNAASGAFFIDARPARDNYDAQQYQIVAVANKEYLIVSKLFGKAAKFNNNMTNSNLLMDVVKMNAAQRWKITKVDDEYYKIVNIGTGLAMAMVNGKLGQLPEDAENETDEEKEAKLWKISVAYEPKFASQPEWEDTFDGGSINADVWTFNPNTKRSAEEVEADRGPDKSKPNRPELSSNLESNLSFKKKTAVLSLNLEGEDKITGTSFNTKGKKSFKYGRFEVWAKLPYGEGAQASVFLANDEGGDANRSEVNIFEFFGGIQDNVISSTAHFLNNDYHVMNTVAQFEISTGGIMADKFHLFALEWEETMIRFYVDGILYGTFSFNTAARESFQKEHYLGMNISALAPSEPGKSVKSPDSFKNTYPQHLQIDSIKYFPWEPVTEE